MCFPQPKVDNSYQNWAIEQANKARAEEEARQARITKGLNEIKVIFEGGKTGTTFNPLAITDLSTPGIAAVRKITGYQGDNAKNPIYTEISPAVAGVPKFKVGDLTFGDKAKAEAYAKAHGTTTGGTEVAGMEPLLAQREGALRDYYLPQLDDKRDDATNELTYALSRAGLLTSTVAGERQADLGEEFALQKAATLGDIASRVSGARTALTQNRNSIEAALRSSGDVTAATSQALSSIGNFVPEAETMNPLGDLFYGVSAGIGAGAKGQDVGAIRRSMTPNPLNSGSGRDVR